VITWQNKLHADILPVCASH